MVIARGRVRKRKKKASKPFRDALATPHFPSRRTSHGTAGAWWWVPGRTALFPVMDEVKAWAARREVALVTVPTREAIRALQDEPKRMNAILHRDLLIAYSNPKATGLRRPVASPRMASARALPVVL